MQYRAVTVLAPAKLNLSLDVVGTLPNGYHDLDMVMQTIDLYEKITLRRSNDLALALPGSFVPANDKKGVGDLIKPLPPCPDCWFVVAMPSVGVSTPEAFARYDTMGSPVHPDCEAQEQAIRANDLRGVCAAAGNALEHCSGAVETPAICKTLRAHGAVTAQMTGSGAAVFGIFESEEAARSAAEAVRAQWPQVYVARPDRGGARVISPKWML